MSTEVQEAKTELTKAEAIREHLAKKKPRYRPVHLVDGDILWIRSLTNGENSGASEAAIDSKGRTNQGRYHRELIVRSLVTGPDATDPATIQAWEDSGQKYERVFKDSEQSLVINWQHFVVQPLVSRIDQLNSFGEVFGWPEIPDLPDEDSPEATAQPAAVTVVQPCTNALETIGG